MFDDLEYPHKTGDVLMLENGNGTTVRVEVHGECCDTGAPLYAVTIDGLVTWDELEAIARLLHPRGLTAQGHAQTVSDAAAAWSEVSDAE